MGAALAAFFASHSLPVQPPIRRWLHARLGKVVYLSFYSGVSLAVLVWLVIAAGRAPFVEIWPFANWQLWVPNIVMPLACFLIVFGVAVPNPFSIEGREAERFDPERPGIAGITRHPLLWGITLWAFAHLIANGDLAHVVLFGLFTAFGLIGMFAIDKRRQREWGRDIWIKQARNTAFVPFAGILRGNAGYAELLMDWRRGGMAVILYLTLLFSHPTVIGVSPLSMV